MGRETEELVSPPKSAITISAGFECLELFYKNNVDLYLCYCGIEDCSKGHSFGPTVRNEYLIHYILSGKGSYQAGGHIYELGAGEYFLICPGQTTFYQADREEPWSYLWVGFQGIKAPLYIKYMQLDEDERLVGRCSQTAFLKQLVTQMLEARALTFANELKREGLLYQFLSELASEAEGEEEDLSNGEYPQQIYVEHILNYIEKNYKKEIRVSQLAKEMGLSRSYLSSCFKKTTGQTVQDYLMSLRMEKAEILLTSTATPIGEIASEVGYEDSLAFSKTFKKKNGISPSKYRQEYAGKKEKLQVENRF